MIAGIFLAVANCAIAVRIDGDKILKFISRSSEQLRWFPLVLVILLCSCAIQQTQLNSQLTKTPQELHRYRLSEAVTVNVSNAKAIHLRKEAQWQKMGYIDQGNVFSSTDQVVVIESFNVYEGYPVVKESRLVGFYLPFEKSFVEVNPISIQFNKELLDEK